MTAKRALIIVALVAMIALFRLLPVNSWLVEAETFARLHPIAGAIVYACLAVLSIVALVPGWISMMLAGLVFGLIPGVLLAMIATTVGATAAMLSGRTLLRSWVSRRIQGDARLAALDDAIQEQAFTMVVLTRLAIVIPFNVLNYAYGLTRVNTRTYIGATIVGMLPVVSLYVYLGTLARNMGQILSGDTQIGAGVWWIAAFALIIISVVVVLVRRAMARALARNSSGRPV